MKISLDAGHGGFGVTPGKRCPDGSMYEWDFNSAVVKNMIAELSNYESVQVLRVDDPTGKTDMPLKTRTDKVNAWGSQCHISVHANAAGNGWSDAHGIETFVYKTSLKEAFQLATLVQNELLRNTGLSNRGVKAADLHMLRETHMTAVLCECGFMTNKNEAALLKSNSYRKKVALAIVEGLAKQYKLKKKAAAKVDDGYIIKPGDSFWKLEEKWKMKHGTLLKLNPKVDPGKLKIGQKIKLK
jgi:N-acetylmuramoyl-L-alanine amidase